MIGNNKIRKSNAFTLIELMVASLIFVFVILMSTAVLAATMGNRAKSNATRSTQESARLALEEISREVRIANMYSDYVSGGTNYRYAGIAILNRVSGNLNLVISPSGGTYQGNAIRSSFYRTYTFHKTFYLDTNGGCGVIRVIEQNSFLLPLGTTRTIPGAGTYQNLTNPDPDGICVDTFSVQGQHSFTNIPGTDPVVTNQPFVTIVLEVRNKRTGVKKEEEDRLKLQTTATVKYGFW